MQWRRDKFQQANPSSQDDLFFDSDDDLFQNVDPFFLTGDDIREECEETLDEANDDFPNQHSDEVEVESGPHWARRKISRKVVSRMVRVSPRNQEKYSLFLLLLHVRGPTSWTDLLTVDNFTCSSFHQACLLRNLLDEDEAYVYTLREAVTCDMPRQLRQLFAHILLFCEITDPYALYLQFREEFFDRFLLNDEMLAERTSLLDIQRHLNAANKSLGDFELDLPNVDLSAEVIAPSFNITISTNEALRIEPTLNAEQREALNAILNTIENHDPSIPNMFFIDGPGGSGKTYAYNFLIHKLRSLYKTVSASALTGLASTLIIDGMTTHSTFKVPVPCHENSSCALSSTDPYADFLRSVSCFIIDEISTMEIEVFDAIDRLLRDLMGNDVPFGGKVIVFGGDFRQILPVVKKGSASQIIEKCVVRSPLWTHCRVFKFTANMRLTADEITFKEFLLKIGNGTFPTREEEPFESCISLPHDIVEQNNIISFAFPPNLQLSTLTSHAVLCPTNKSTSAVNDQVLQSLPGTEMTYLSADSVIPNPASTINEVEAYPVEYLNTLSGSGIPPHKLTLKVGCPVILLRHIDPKRGLTNGTRLQVVAMHRHFIDAKVLTGKAINQRVYLTAMPLTPSDTDLPFTFRRKQIPVNLAYALTINKSQGQTFDRVGLFLDRPCFTHGQLYVAMSRVKSRSGLKIYIESGSQQGIHDGNVYTKNIVYTNLLQQT